MEIYTQLTKYFSPVSSNARNVFSHQLRPYPRIPGPYTENQHWQCDPF